VGRPVSISLVEMRCRISDRALGPIRGVEELGGLLARRLEVPSRAIGSGAEPRETTWQSDLREARGCLLEAGGQVEDALSGGRFPLLITSDCAIALTTLPTVARLRPDAQILWLDAHGDFNTPVTSSTGYLGGMALSGACGMWETGFEEQIAADRVALVGVRDLDDAEGRLLADSAVTVIGSSLETLVYTQNALDRAPVYVHLDLDVLDPRDFPAWIPADGGLRADKLYDLLEAVAGECELVGLEVATTQGVTDELESRAAAATALSSLGPLLEAAGRGTRVGH